MVREVNRDRAAHIHRLRAVGRATVRDKAWADKKTHQHALLRWCGRVYSREGQRHISDLPRMVNSRDSMKHHWGGEGRACRVIPRRRDSRQLHSEPVRGSDGADHIAVLVVTHAVRAGQVAVSFLRFGGHGVKQLLSVLEGQRLRPDAQRSFSYQASACAERTDTVSACVRASAGLSFVHTHSGRGD